MSNIENKRKEILSLIIKNEINQDFDLLKHYENPLEDIMYLVKMGYLDRSVLIKTMTGYVISLGGPHCITDAGRKWVEA